MPSLNIGPEGTHTFGKIFWRACGLRRRRQKRNRFAMAGDHYPFSASFHCVQQGREIGLGFQNADFTHRSLQF